MHQPGPRQHVCQRCPGHGQRKQAGHHLAGEAVEIVVIIGRHHGDAHPGSAADSTGQRAVGMQRGVAAADHHHPDRFGGPHDQHRVGRRDLDRPAAGFRTAWEHDGEASPAGRRYSGAAGRKPRSLCRSASPGDVIDLLESGPAESEMATMTAERQQHRLGQGRRTCGRREDPSNHRATADREHRRCRRPAAARRAVAAADSGLVFRGWVASSTAAPGAQMLGAQHGVGGGSQQHNDVAVGDGGQLGRWSAPEPGPATSAANDESLAEPRATSSNSATSPSRASNLVTADPTLPVAPTTATRPCGALASRLRTWRCTIAAVKALPLVTPMSVRRRSTIPPFVTGAVSPPSPTRSAPDRTARSTAATDLAGSRAAGRAGDVLRTEGHQNQLTDPASRRAGSRRTSMGGNGSRRSAWS